MRDSFKGCVGSLFCIWNSENMTKHFTTASVAGKGNLSAAPAEMYCESEYGLGDYDFRHCKLQLLPRSRSRNSVRHRPASVVDSAHFALHNIEQLTLFDQREIAGSGKRPPAFCLNDLPGNAPQPTEVIDGANGEAPWVSVDGGNSRISGGPRRYVRVSRGEDDEILEHGCRVTGRYRRES